MDLGQTLRGVDMGPGAMRYAGLAARLKRLGHRVEDTGNVTVAVRDTVSEQDAQAFVPSIRATCEEVYAKARRALRDGRFPLFLGGDHSLAIGTIGGVSEGARTGVLWVDAHGDFNTPETSLTGNVHGMPLATLLGLGSPELVGLGRPGPKLRVEDVVLIGVRALDRPERELLREHNLTVYTMRDVDERGMAPIVHEALERLGDVERLHLSFDLDSLDPEVAPGVGTPVPGGLTYREAHLLMEILADSRRVTSADVVEVNPILDEHNRTAVMAVELIASLLGKSIL